MDPMNRKVSNVSFVVHFRRAIFVAAPVTF